MSIGNKIKTFRKDAGLTIPQLAETTGLSRGFISQVENDKVSLSLESLEKIANALKIQMKDLIADQGLPPELVTKDARTSIKKGNCPEMQVLSSTFGRQLQVLLVTLPSGYQTGDESHTHDGEEFITVLRGKVKVIQGDFSAILEKGDSVHLDSSKPHLCQNAIDEESEIIVVLTPPTLLPMKKSNHAHTE